MTTLPADSVCVHLCRVLVFFSSTICELLSNFKVTMAYITGTLSQSNKGKQISYLCLVIYLFPSEVVTTFLFIVYIAMGIFVYCDILLILNVFELFYFFLRKTVFIS